MKLIKIIILSIPFIIMTERSSKVSWYGKKFQGKQTASGEIYNMNDYTCAVTWNPKTKKLGYPFGTKLKVTNINNNKSVIVTVNDTGSFSKYGRTLDLSKAAFAAISDPDVGVIDVKIKRLK